MAEAGIMQFQSIGLTGFSIGKLNVKPNVPRVLLPRFRPSFSLWKSGISGSYSRAWLV